MGGVIPPSNPVTPWLPLILKVVEIIYDSITAHSESGSGTNVTFTTDGKGKVTATVPNGMSFSTDSIISAKTPDGNVTKIYGLKIESSGSSSGN